MPSTHCLSFALLIAAISAYMAGSQPQLKLLTNLKKLIDFKKYQWRVHCVTWSGQILSKMTLEAPIVTKLLLPIIKEIVQYFLEQNMREDF